MSAEESDKPLFGRQFEMDTACMELLAEFFEWLKSPSGAALTPEEASPLAHEADRYLRDFMTEILEFTPSDSTDAVAESYLANWYVINTLMPEPAEISKIARALILLHRYMADKGTITLPMACRVEKLFEDTAFFISRLEEFWNLAPQEITAWRTCADYRRFLHQM